MKRRSGDGRARCVPATVALTAILATGVAARAGDPAAPATAAAADAARRHAAPPAPDWGADERAPRVEGPREVGGTGDARFGPPDAEEAPPAPTAKPFDGSLLQKELDAVFSRVRDIPIFEVLDLPVSASLTGEARYRGEFRDPFSLAPRGDRGSDTLGLFRVRLGVDVKVGDVAEAAFELQDAEVVSHPADPDPPGLQESIDIQQAWIELTPMGREGDRVSARVGRQNLDYGKVRLVGSAQYGNVARPFDAGRGRVFFGDFVLDAVLGYSVKRVDDHLATPDDDIVLQLVQLQWNAPGKRVVEVYEIAKLDRRRDRALGEDGRRDDVEILTMGGRAEGPLLFGFDFSVEGAIQWGRVARDEVRAWAFHTGLAYEPPPVPFRSRFFVEVNQASGDGDPNDGRIERFDDLFAANHYHYGFMDLFGWTNLQDYVAGVRLWPLDKVMLGADVHLFRLDQREDAWFGANGMPLRPRDPTGGSGQTVGWELDLILRWKPNAYVTLEAVYGRFRPLGFAQRTDPQLDGSDAAHLGYVMVRFAF